MSSEKKSTSLKIYSSDITISNLLEDVPIALQTFKTFAQNCEIPLQTTSKIQKLLVELLDTIIEFNCSNNTLDNNISIEFNLFQLGKLTININYKGMPFNPFGTNTIDLLRSKNQEFGGLGLHLVKRLMDEYTYNRVQQLNVVSMCKTQI